MPFATFTVRRGLSAADKSRLSEAMLEAQVAAGYKPGGENVAVTERQTTT